MTKNSLSHLTIIEAKDGLKNKTFSTKELVDSCIETIEKTEDLNAFITVTKKHALKQAEVIDKKICNSEDLGIMEGIPIAIKDLFCTKNTKTTAGSKILSNFIPQYESTVTKNLWDSGAIMLGKTNLDEFAMGSANLTSYYGPVKNPYKPANHPDKILVPGGSSGGSATAVSGNLSIAATGTDTGGSIRQPAAFSGIVGVKPTYGLCSRWGVVAFASSLDQAGPMTKNVRDAAIMLQAMAGYDKKDSTSLEYTVPDYNSLLTGNIKGLKIGIPKEFNIADIDHDIAKNWQSSIKQMQNFGAEITEISMPHMKYSLPTYYILASAEASSNLSRYDGIRYGIRAKDAQGIDDLYCKTRGEGFGTEVKKRIMIGTYVLSAGYYDAYYNKAQKLRALIKQDFKNAYQKVDLIFTPTTPTTAFGMNEKQNDPITMYMNDILTVPANIAGLPSISVPTGLSTNGLPIGMQFIAPKLQELCMFNAGLFLEKNSNFKRKI